MVWLRIIGGLAACTLLTSCGAPEALEATITPEARQAELPEIAPLSPLLEGPEPRLTGEDAERLMARGRAADARAAGLQ